jgi:toxin ParE1/3/4
MAKRYRVALVRVALADLEELAAYMRHRDSEAAARRQLENLRKRIRALATNPGRGRVPPELAERGIRTWREAIVAPWRIIYRVESRKVYVLMLVDGRRDLSELLLRRLTRP